MMMMMLMMMMMFLLLLSISCTVQFHVVPVDHRCCCSLLAANNKEPLVGLVVKASVSRAQDPGLESRLRRDFSGSSQNCQAPNVIRSAHGLLGPVSVYCDWVRWKVGSATSISVWQHVKLSSEIRPRDTLACCWDVKQPTNKYNKSLLREDFISPWVPMVGF